jgi:hypothetical protein
MFLDAENTFTSGGPAGQSLTGAISGNTVLANVIDSGPLGGQNTPAPPGQTAPYANAGRDWGMGYPVWLIIGFPQTVAPNTATVAFDVLSSASPTLSGTPNQMFHVPGATGATLAPNIQGRFPFPRLGVGGTGWLRFLGVQMSSTAALTGGALFVGITRDPQDGTLYIIGYVVQ